MTKVEMIKVINNKIEEMQPMIARTGLKRKILLVHKLSATFPMTMVRAGYKWLFAIHDRYFKECKRLRAMCTDEVWDQYASMAGMGTEDLTEVDLMNKSLAKLRKALVSKTRPEFFKREAQREAVKRHKK